MIHITRKLHCFVGLAAFVVAHAAFATTLFQDGFESGNLSYTQNSIAWGSSVYTSVQSTEPRSGADSLRFRYVPVAPGTDDWSEQRVQLTNPYPELWFQFDLFIPSNRPVPTLLGKISITH